MNSINVIDVPSARRPRLTHYPDALPAAPQPRDFPGPLAVSDEQAIDLLRQVLDHAGFSEKGVREALGEGNARLQLKRLDFPLYERRLRAPCALHTLIRLFMMQLQVDPAEAAAALAPLCPDRLVALGLLERGSGGFHSVCALSLCDGLLIAHDRVEQEGASPDADYVLGVNASAFTLANLTARPQARRTLDLGAGSGMQALLASRHSECVVATDNNPRALNYLQFNARLNGATNIECRLGSWYEPVAGCQFDLIVCNPPYVISPESRFIYRDSGLPGDQVCQQVVRQAPAYLAEGGFATVLCNWAHRRDEDWSTPVRRWVEGCGCDVWVLRGGVEDTLSYAAGWTRGPDAGAYGTALDEWQEYYHRLGIEAVSMGPVILRRRSSGPPNWFRAEEWPGKPTGSCSQHLLRIFQAEAFARESDAALLEQTFILAPDHVLQQQLRIGDGQVTSAQCRIELEQGLRFQGNLDMYSLCLLSCLNGRQTLAQALVTVSQRAGVAVEQIQSQALAAVRQLLACGFLLPFLPGEESASACRVAGPECGLQPVQRAASQ